MWTLLFLLYLGTLDFTVSSSPPSPVNVVFSSVNLRNVLHWSPGNGTSEDTLFTVQYAIYGDIVEGSKRRQVNWRPVSQCTDIVRSWCDLSNETLDQEQGYHARVHALGSRASSKWVVTLRRFDPKLDTTLGPPLVSVEIEGNKAIITLKGPMRYQPNNHTPVISMATIYSQMSYKLSIHNVQRNQTLYFPVQSHLYKHQVMHQTEYCFSAKTRLLSIPMQCQSSAWHCITTPQDPVTVHLLRVIWGIVVPSLCICVLMVVGYFLHSYLMGKGQKKPDTLKTLSFHPPLPLPPESANLLVISVIKYESDTDSAISDTACYKKKMADLPVSYSLQRPEAPLEPDDLSVDYGFVGMAPQIKVDGEEEAGDQRQDRDDGNNLLTAHQICTPGESHDEKEWRVEDGHSAGVESYLSQTHIPTHSQTHAHTEMSTLVQARAWSQSKSLLLSQIQGSLLSDQGGTYEDKECPGSFVNKTPQTGLLHVPLNPQTRMKLETGEKKEEKARVRRNGKIDGAAEEGSQSETVALLSAYASQNMVHVPISLTDQSDFLPNEYGFLSVSTAHNIVEDEEEEEEEGEEEEGNICIKWDPKTRKFVFPEVASGGLMWAEEESENRMGGEEAYVAKGELKLENVFIRQASEEEAEALREEERGGESGRDGADGVLSKWNLVISMDQ
ncbi:interleukin-20 receptor subunit alpha [Paralichthys olivaceus]|uniref:interleukin-20 receptor subunit alpha n=1 Tax=Paralichthys olivaceus TaxID=8255 RepID=UPI003750C8D0